MEKINCLHLYYDLMNLYGESGNITGLVGSCNRHDVKITVDKKTIGDEIDFSSYDIVVVGDGNEAYELLALEDILKRKKEIKASLKNTTWIVTGNALDLFGKELDGKDCLGFFDFKSSTVDTRVVGEVHGNFPGLEYPILGFLNNGTVNTFKDLRSNNFMEVDGKLKGIKEGKFYGIHMVGPLLVRNPYFTDMIVEDICKKKNIDFKKLDYQEPDYIAYQEYLNNFNIKDVSE